MCQKQNDGTGDLDFLGTVFLPAAAEFYLAGEP